jgi:DNA-binding MarR family transcriptional regulator
MPQYGIVLRYRSVIKSRRSKQKHLVEDSEYRALSEFRQRIHDYLDFSDHAARSEGIEPRQYQLMLAIRGLPVGVEPTVGTLASRLRVRHHSAVELIDRAGRNGFVKRERSADGRCVLVQLTPKGLDILERAVAERLEELQSAGPVLVVALRRLLRSKNGSQTAKK